MMDSTNEMESDLSSIDGGYTEKVASPVNGEQLQNRMQSLKQENKVLKIELEQLKSKCKALQEENIKLRQASVSIQAQAEQEEEYISNILLKQIQELKKEKETLAKKFEQEEEFLTNDLSRRLSQLRQEKADLEMTLEKEQEQQVNKLMRRIEKLQAETVSKQAQLEKLRREKIELENTLEHEQEALVNRLWKKMEKLEAEKRMLQERLDQPVSTPPSPCAMQIDDGCGVDIAGNLSQHIQLLRAEVVRLRSKLTVSQTEQSEKMAHFVQEEKHLREEKVHLERKLQREIERREALCRHLSESESCLEMDEERIFNELSKQQDRGIHSNRSSTCAMHGIMPPHRVTSPVPMLSPGSSRSISPAVYSTPNPATARYGHGIPSGHYGLVHTGHMPIGGSLPPNLPGTSPPNVQLFNMKSRSTPATFLKPAPPPPAQLTNQQATAHSTQVSTDGVI